MNVEEIKTNNLNIEKQADNIAEIETNEQPVKESLDCECKEADKVSEELAELKDSYLRLIAEYDNYRKRTLKEKTELIKNGGEKVIIGLLPVIDDFERALENVEKATDIGSVVKGIQLIYNKFISYLNQQGVKSIEATGQFFDEELFDAIATLPAPEKDMKGKVIDCIQTGYSMNDKVIRHAKVIVGE